jgi:hypothetical protein
MTKKKRSELMTRKNSQPLTGLVFLAGAGVGTLSVCFFFFVIVLIDRL